MTEYGPGDPRAFYAKYNKPAAAPAPYTLGGQPVDSNPGWAVPAAAPVSQLSGEPDQRAADAYKLIENVGAEFEEHAQRVDREAFDESSGRWRLGPEDRKTAVQNFARNPKVEQQINESVKLVSDMRDEAAAEVDQIRNNLIPDRDQTKAMRDWQRQERLLESAKSEGERIARAKEIFRETTDPGAFATALEEVGPYLKSHGDRVDWMEDEIAERIPELGAARQKLSAWDRQLTKAEFNAEQQRKMLATGHSAKYLLKPD